MQQMKSVYVWRMVQDNYNDMIVSLINQLPLMESSMDFSVKASSSANHETPALNGIFGQDPLPPLSRVFGGVRRRGSTVGSCAGVALGCFGFHHWFLIGKS